MNYRFYGQFAARGTLEPVAVPPGLRRVLEADFFDTALTPFRWDGEQVCLPQNVSSLVVYYNTDLFRRAGVALPKDGWSWDDMVAAATKLTRDRDGDGTVDTYGLGVDPEIIRVAPFIWSNGGRAGRRRDVADAVRPGRGAVVALDQFFDLRTVHGVTPTDEEAEAEDFVSRFLNGRLGMLMESRRVVPTLRTITDFEWDVAGTPCCDAPASVLHSDAYCMTEGSDAKDEAWRFMEYALGPEGQRIASEAGRTVPSLRSVAETEAFLDPNEPPANAQVFLDQIPYLRSVPPSRPGRRSRTRRTGCSRRPITGEGPVSRSRWSSRRRPADQFARAEI